MCGIVALIRTSDRPLPSGEVLHRMAAAIAHRGPDDCGSYVDADVMLGVVRLAIVDPKSGHQPVSGCRPGLVTVYNGEIYNHRSLRAELLDRGHRVPGSCDATILPHLFEEHGADLVHHLCGMFAFAIWDAVDRRLLLARDRLGIKPLYYAQTPDCLLVASEIKAILASRLVPAAIDRDSLDDIFSLSYPCAPRTMFRGILELRPGHLVTVRPGVPLGVPRRYWRAPFPNRGEHRRERPADLVESLRVTLLEAVRSHLAADVPVGVCLSGGIDSSTVAALAREVTGVPPSMVSITFEDPAFDESEHAQIVARHLGGTTELVRAEATAAELYPEVIWSHEMPLIVSGPIGGLLMGELGRQRGVLVALTGDGADEIFGGYDVFPLSRVRRALSPSLLRPLRPAVIRGLCRLTNQPPGLGDVLVDVLCHRPVPECAIYPPWYPMWHLFDLERESLLSPDGRGVRPVHVPPTGFDALVRADHAQLHPLDAELALELETRLPSWILVISDRTAMAHGIETRVPFLDHRVVELVASLPPELKLRGLGEKAALRNAVGDLLPASIRARRKRPFMAPIGPWFFSAAAPTFVEDELAPDSVRAAGLFAPAVVSRLREELARAPAPHVRRARLEVMLLAILGTQLLHRQFVRDFQPANHQRFSLRHADGTPVPEDGL
jgi:asparagine synthase (glutamine-hydrolysing)